MLELLITSSHAAGSTQMTPSRPAKTSSAVFQGCVLAFHAPRDIGVSGTAWNYIEQKGGQLLTDGSISKATHVVLQHQQQPEYAEAVRHGKQAVSVFWIIACAEAGHLQACSDALHRPFPSANIPDAKGYGVSVTGFQGIHRQLLLDMLRCMGVDVQKEMRLASATHIIAQDVDDTSSKKLQHARMPEWRNKISIVSCKWVYDCIKQWQILPAGAFTSNCSLAEVLAWQGQPKAQNHTTPAVARHAALRASLPSQGANAAPVPKSTLPSGAAAAQQPHASSTAGNAAAMVSAVPGQQQTGNQRRSGKHERLSLSLKQQHPQQQQQQQHPPQQRQKQQQQQEQHMQLAEPAVHLQPAAQATAAASTRESLGGTQGAVAGLTHLSLQRHDEAMQQAAVAHSGLMPSEDTQALGLQVADAEAATARLVAQMAEPSPVDEAAAEPISPMCSEDVFEQAQQHMPAQGRKQGTKTAAKELQAAARKSGTGAKPKATAGRGQASKRGSAVESEVAADKSAPKRQKVAEADLQREDAHQAAHGLIQNVPASVKEKLGGKPEEFVGRELQQEFEEGTFKGKVTGYSGQSKWFHVVYEDGDRQDMTWKELQPCLLPLASTKHPTDIKTGRGKRKLQPAATNGKGKLQSRDNATGRSSNAEPATPNVASPSPTSSPECRSNAEEAQLANEEYRADTAFPARPSTGNSPWASGGSPERPLLVLGSMHTWEQQTNTAKLTKIGVPCLTHKQCPRWDLRITHVILPTLVRSVKSLAGLAGGRWILSTDFIEACASAESLVEPDEFELHQSDKAVIAAGAPRHWRLRYQQLSIGAFQGLHVLIYGSCDKPGPDKDDFALIIQCGDGSVSKTDKAASTLTKLIAKGLQLAVVSSSKESADAGVQQLLKAKVPCATSHFLIDWLAHPKADLSSHMVFSSKIAWSEQLQRACKSRSSIS